MHHAVKIDTLKAFTKMTAHVNNQLALWYVAIRDREACRRLENKLQQLASYHKAESLAGESSCSYCFTFTKLINHLNLHNVIKCSN